MSFNTKATDEQARGAQRPAVGHGFVVVCLLLALALLVPGVMGRLGVTVDGNTMHGAALRQLWAALDDIRFGSGLRFWLGVAGAIAMALLLAYPLRKLMASRRFLGSIAGWFKLHLLIGVFAPVAILYHTNFGLGGRNANVALWTMLAVALSGIVGHFIYARASAAFYSDKQTARRHLDAALSLITSLGGTPAPRDRLADRLDAFDVEQLTPRAGIRAALSARYAVATSKRTLIQEAVVIVDAAAREMRLATNLHTEARTNVAHLLHAYFAFAGRAANRSVREQLWARWRLFHLPLFLVMCAATVLHVVAVWDMDGPAEPIRPAGPAGSAPPPRVIAKDQVASERASPIQQTKRATIAIDSKPKAETGPQPPQPVQISRPRPPAPPVSEPVAAVAASAPLAKAEPAPPPKPVERTVPPPSPPPRDTKVFEDLATRTASDTQRMGLGGVRTLEQQIATYKDKIKTREFKHSDAETGFALTGKHTRADCTDCHTKPLQETRSEQPRACVACHTKDDVHKGRRPDCADCHTTNSFRDRKKKGR